MRSKPVTHTAIGQKKADSLPKTSKDEVPNKFAEGNVHRYLRNAYQRQGDFKIAIDYHERRIRSAKEVEDRAGIGNDHGNLSNAHQGLEDFETAIHYYERHLKIAKEVEDKAGEGSAYCNLGDAYQRLGDFKTAVDYHERHLKIAKQVGDKFGEGLAYGSLGNAYGNLGDFKTATDYYERHLKIAKEVGDEDGEGKTYGNLGIIYKNQGDFKTAIDCHERHLRIAKKVGDKVGEGGAYGNLGNAYQRLGDLKTAIAYHERHLKIAKEVGDKVGEGGAYGCLGNAYQCLGDFKTAIDYHERHLKISTEVKDKAGEGRAYGSFGNVCQSLGDFKTAINYYERHLKIVKEVGDKVGEGRSYGNLGAVYESQGDFLTAINYYKRDLKTAEEVGDKAGEGSTYGNLGSAYGSLGYFKRAIDYHERHLKIAKEVEDKAGKGKAYGNLGDDYVDLGDFKTAIDYYERQLKLAKEVGDKVGEGCAYSGLGNAYQGQGDFKTATEYHERHLKIAKEVGNKAKEGCAYGNLGNAYRVQGDLKTAIDYYERHLKIAQEVGDKVRAAVAFRCLGMSFELLKLFPKALDCFYSSVRMLNIIRHDLKGKDEWKINYRNMHEIVYFCLWRLLLNQGKVVEALFAADQGRAQALNDMMELNYGFETSYCQLHTQEERTFDSYSFLSSTAVFITIDERDIVFWIVQNGREVELRKKKFDDCSINLRDFLRSLIVTASQEIGVRVGVKCEDRSLDKPRGEQVVNGRSPQTPAKPVPFQLNALRMFYHVIIEPIVDLIDGDELILVPEGPLGLAPYAAFVDSNSRYLCEVCRIRVIPSLTSLKLITDSPACYHSKTGVLLVGDPWVQEVAIPGIILEQLKFARKEVQMIGKIFNTEPLIGREATKDEVLRRLPTVALIHIAAHGRMETGEIALAPNTTRTSQIPANKDFLLTMKDVKSAKIRARLVVLSCCHSGRGEIKAEGVVGIARAFLGAGARAVLVSMWAIDDGATLEFMKSFYSYLVNGISASESLNKAMKHMRESDEFNEVKHWAPFVLIGDDVTLECGGSK